MVLAASEADGEKKTAPRRELWEWGYSRDPPLAAEMCPGSRLSLACPSPAGSSGHVPHWAEMGGWRGGTGGRLEQSPGGKSDKNDRKKQGKKGSHGIATDLGVWGVFFNCRRVKISCVRGGKSRRCVR